MSLPTLLSVFYSFGSGDASGAFTTLLISLLTLLIYCVATHYLVFKTDRVIAKLRLLENFPEDPVPLNIHRSTVVSISLLLVAIYVIAQAIPQCVRGLVKWYQYNKMAGLYNAMEGFDYSTVLVYAAEIVIGLLLIGYHRSLVNYIELKSRNPKA